MNRRISSLRTQPTMTSVVIANQSSRSAAPYIQHLLRKWHVHSWFWAQNGAQSALDWFNSRSVHNTPFILISILSSLCTWNTKMVYYYQALQIIIIYTSHFPGCYMSVSCSVKVIDILCCFCQVRRMYWHRRRKNQRMTQVKMFIHF